MSTIATTSNLSLRSASAGAVPNAAPSTVPAEGGRGLSVLLLAAVVAAMVVLADRLISTWADGHLLLAWVFLWVVVFASMALFADTARTLAGRALRALDEWSQVLAQARADARLWTAAQSDPRLMEELRQAIARDREQTEALMALQSAPAQDFSAALAPLGMSNDTNAAREQGGGWAAYMDRLVQQRSRSVPAYYI